MPSKSSLGFAGGLLGGLSQSLAANRESARQAEERKQQHYLAAVNMLMPLVKNQADLEPFLAGALPEVFGEQAQKSRGKNAPDHAGMVRKVLGHALSQPGDPMTPGPAGQEPLPQEQRPNFMGPVSENQPVESRPFGPAAGSTPPPKPRTLGGIQILSPEEQSQRKTDLGITAEQQQITAKVGLARRILPLLQSVDSSATLDDALATVGIRTPRSTGVSTFQQVKGKLDGKDAFGVFDVRSGQFLDPATHQPLQGFTPNTEGADYHYGVDREALAQSLFGNDFGKLEQPQKEIVIREEKRMLQEEAKARGTGTGQARFERPADLQTAQATGVPAGTSAADVAGQTVPTGPEKEKRRSVETLKTSLEDIRDRLLAPILPTASELGGKAPGLTMMYRRRAPEFREANASLEAAVNNVVNVVARSVGEQRGTQTETDALRAEAAITSLRDTLLQGDTLESSTARVNETIKILDRILGGLPVAPTPKEKPAGAPPADMKPVPSHTPAGQLPAPKGMEWVNGQLMIKQ